MAASRNSPSADLVARVGAFVDQHVARDEPLGLGLSGGCDSVVLLHVLHALGWRDRLQVVHVHHGLSPNADAWSAFCSSLCQTMAVPLTICRVQVDRVSGSGIEAAAREARYQAFAEMAPPTLMLAQHRGDQAETLLLNLLRGGGLTGAAAMPAVRQRGAQRILRPLLQVSRSSIEAYARQHGLSWIDDESNDNTALTRNFVRHQMLRPLAMRFPDAEGRLAASAGHFGEALALLDELAAEDWGRLAQEDALPIAGLRCLSVARAKHLLRWRLRQLGWQVPGAERLEEFVRQLFEAGPDRHPELRLPAGRLRLSRGRLRWMPAA